VIGSPVTVRWDRAGRQVVAFTDAAVADAARGLDLRGDPLPPGAVAGDGGAFGRGRTGVIALPGSGVRVYLRAFHHGGWLAPVTGDRLAGPGRVLAELRVHRALFERGAPVPRPLLATATRCGPGRWTALFGTAEVAGALNLRAWLAAPQPEAAVRTVIRAAGAALRRLHDAGGAHADLHVGNLLLRSSDAGPEIFVVDLDRARLRAAVSPGRRLRELMRLARSLEKHGLWDRLPPGSAREFLAAYCDGDADLAGALRRHLPRERRRLARHRLGWRLLRPRLPQP
jgi:3-deoxy-D-manno-octulosonic acid kinase